MGRGGREHQVTKSRKRGKCPVANHAPASPAAVLALCWVPEVSLVSKQPSQEGFAPQRELVLAYSLQSYKHTKDNLSSSSKREYWQEGHWLWDKVGISSRSEPKINRSDTWGQRAGGMRRVRSPHPWGNRVPTRPIPPAAPTGAPSRNRQPETDSTL